MHQVKLEGKIELEDLGIYTNIIESDNRDPWSGRHKMYYADCKVCGRTVERTMYNLRVFNKICHHKKYEKTGIESNIPKNFLSDSYNKRVYNLWRNMVVRTTEGYWEKHPTYVGTAVSDNWKNFMTFYKDIKELDGYDLWLNGCGERVMLDKDTKGSESKIYDKYTCCFITQTDSNRDVARRNPQKIDKLREAARIKSVESSMPVRANNKKTNETIEFQSLRECSRALGLNHRNLWMCASLEEKYESHKSVKGWVVKYI